MSLASVEEPMIMEHHDGALSTTTPENMASLGYNPSIQQYPVPQSLSHLLAETKP